MSNTLWVTIGIRRPSDLGLDACGNGLLTIAFLEARSPWSPPEIPDCLTLFELLAVEGSVLDGAELYAVGVSLVSGGQLAEAFDTEASPASALAFIRRRLHTDRDLRDRIAKTTDASGEILDTASPDLRRIRRRLRGARSKIVRKLEAFIADLPERVRVADASVGVRDGRYVVPVRRDGKRDVGGIVHDESQTGATLFVEPPMAIELTNELRGLEQEETREIHRVLSEITQALRPLHPSLTASWEALVEFDSLGARSRAAIAWGACRPELSGESEGWTIVRGRHPLLLASSDDPVVPFDLSLEPGERIVVVSGPNTGGKSVFLKAVGLIASLTQSGVVPPVEDGTRLPVFDSIFADIGDEQSIAESLSTFSAHLTTWKEVVERAGSGSLVLLDEMGTGTDPTELVHWHGPARFVIPVIMYLLVAPVTPGELPSCLVVGSALHLLLHHAVDLLRILSVDISASKRRLNAGRHFYTSEVNSGMCYLFLFDSCNTVSESEHKRLHSSLNIAWVSQSIRAGPARSACTR